MSHVSKHTQTLHRHAREAIRVLQEHGPMCVTELCETCDVPRTSLSRGLRFGLENGWVGRTDVREGHGGPKYLWHFICEPPQCPSPVRAANTTCPLPDFVQVTLTGDTRQVALHPGEVSHHSGVQLVTASGLRIDIAVGFDIATLQRVLALTNA